MPPVAGTVQRSPPWEKAIVSPWTSGKRRSRASFVEVRHVLGGRRGHGQDREETRGQSYREKTLHVMRYGRGRGGVSLSPRQLAHRMSGRETAYRESRPPLHGRRARLHPPPRRARRDARRRGGRPRPRRGVRLRPRARPGAPDAPREGHRPGAALRAARRLARLPGHRPLHAEEPLRGLLRGGGRPARRPGARPGRGLRRGRERAPRARPAVGAAPPRRSGRAVAARGHAPHAPAHELRRPRAGAGRRGDRDPPGAPRGRRRGEARHASSAPTSTASTRGSSTRSGPCATCRRSSRGSRRSPACARATTSPWPGACRPRAPRSTRATRTSR